MIVLKFGGTSVGSAKAIKQVYEIVSGITESRVVVVSAMSGVTDSLIKALTLAASNDKSYEEVFNTIKDKHNDVSLELFGEEIDSIKELLSELEQILFSIYKLGEVSDKANALVQSFGERLNARIVSRYFQAKGLKSSPVDATTFLITTTDYLDANPLYDESKRRASKVLG
ncbi:MAG: bifunctional aspartate kinase/homoserine dehydrogenase I, partial [Caldisericaceae bacterium]